MAPSLWLALALNVASKVITVAATGTRRHETIRKAQQGLAPGTPLLCVDFMGDGRVNQTRIRNWLMRHGWEVVEAMVAVSDLAASVKAELEAVAKHQGG